MNTLIEKSYQKVRDIDTRFIRNTISSLTYYNSKVEKNET